jgi:sigma-B regulation protein RsbU (phosphoserine phosphatase)
MCMDGRPPSAAISRVNDLILADTYSEWFVTLFYGVLDPRWGIFNFVNAGHTKPVLYRAASGKMEELYTNGMALGVEPGIDLAEKSVKLEPGDLVLMYTDGISEALDVHGEFYGERRIRSTLKKLAAGSSREILDEVQRSVLNFSRGRSSSDDATAILIKRKA